MTSAIVMAKPHDSCNVSASCLCILDMVGLCVSFIHGQCGHGDYSTRFGGECIETVIHPRTGKAFPLLSNLGYFSNGGISTLSTLYGPPFRGERQSLR